MAQKKQFAGLKIENYFEAYVNEKVRTGKYASVSEIVRTALRLLEAEEQKAKTLINETNKELMRSQKLSFLQKKFIARFFNPTLIVFLPRM